MGAISIPSALSCSKTLSTSPKSIHKARIVNSCGPKVKSKVEMFFQSPHKITHSYEASTYGLNRNGGCMAVACGAKDSTGSPEEQKALETVLKLYDAMKNKNHCELSDIISEDCLCISNFVSTFQPFYGKKQVLAFFSSLMKSLGNNIEFVVQVQHTLDDGMIVGVSWKLEWNKVPIPLPLGKGFSFYMCHFYRGKVMIKNVEIFLEPLLQVEPFRLKIIASVMNVMEKLNPQALFRNRERRAVKLMFILLFLAAMAFVLGHRKPA